MLYTIQNKIPNDYHCDCEYCQQFKGVILNRFGGYINCRSRKGYYNLGLHIAKTPFPIAMWAVDNFTKPKDWVFDPTIGIGTTAVEAKKQGRYGEGIELSLAYAKGAAANCQLHTGKHMIINGDIRNWRTYLEALFPPQLIISNPPYSGDENVSIKTDIDGEIIDRDYHDYINDPRNLAFLKEGPEYYKIMSEIYNGLGKCFLLENGYFVIGVKDMIHNKQPYLLHHYLADIIDKNIFEYWGMVLLPHWPRTLFMNTYPKRFPEVKVPLYQTILVWRKR